MGGNRTDLRIEKCRTRRLSITHESLVGGVTRTEGFLRLSWHLQRGRESVAETARARGQRNDLVEVRAICQSVLLGPRGQIDGIRVLRRRAFQQRDQPVGSSTAALQEDQVHCGQPWTDAYS